MRFETEKSKWNKFFNEVSVGYFGKQYAETKVLTKAMDKELANIDENVRTKLYYLFDYEGEEIISEKAFMSLMTIWSAFSANDINNDNELDANEVKQLFWLFDSKKPSRDKILRETLIMDTDGSGTIDRLEWMAYLCSSAFNKSGKGSKDYYDFELRAAFEAVDTDKDGVIRLPDLIEFLKKQCESSLTKIPES